MKENVFADYAEEFERRLRISSFPLAVKLLQTEADIPKGTIRPKRDWGYHYSLCQAFAMSRREGTAIAMLKEDMWCFEPVIGYGLAEPPQYFLDGYNRFPDTAKTLEAGRNWAQAFPRLEVGRYIGVMSAPLKTANFEPDLVMIYCTPAQLTQLLIAVNWIDGRDITCRMSGHAACVYSVVPVVQSGQCQVTSPCRGDLGRAAASEHEMIFTAPTEKVTDLVTALRQLGETMFRLPIIPTLKPEYKLLESYEKIGRMIGMEV